MMCVFTVETMNDRISLVTCHHRGSLSLLSLSLLMTAQKAFVDSVDQDQTVQNMQSDL